MLNLLNESSKLLPYPPTSSNNGQADSVTSSLSITIIIIIFHIGCITALVMCLQNLRFTNKLHSKRTERPTATEILCTAADWWYPISIHLPLSLKYGASQRMQRRARKRFTCLPSRGSIDNTA